MRVCEELLSSWPGGAECTLPRVGLRNKNRVVFADSAILTKGRVVRCVSVQKLSSNWNNNTVHSDWALRRHLLSSAENLRTLADLLNEFPSLVKGSRFVFVPGPRDPGHANILPRCVGTAWIQCVCVCVCACVCS